MANLKENRHKKVPRRSGVGTGTTSLLVIFTLLFMSTLGLLSLSTALSNQRIMARGFSSMHSLTTAKGEAALELAELDDALVAARGDGEKGYNAKAEEIFTQRGWEVNSDEQTARFYVTIDEKNALVTQVEITAYTSEFRYTVTGQTMLMVGEWLPESGIVWSPIG